MKRPDLLHTLSVPRVAWMIVLALVLFGPFWLAHLVRQAFRRLKPW